MARGFKGMKTRHQGIFFEIGLTILLILGLALGSSLQGRTLAQVTALVLGTEVDLAAQVSPSAR